MIVWDMLMLWVSGEDEQDEPSEVSMALAAGAGAGWCAACAGVTVALLEQAR